MKFENTLLNFAKHFLQDSRNSDFIVLIIYRMNNFLMIKFTDYSRTSVVRLTPDGSFTTAILNSFLSP